MVLFTQFGLLLIGARGEIGFPTRTEVDVPTPKPANEGVGTFVILRPELTVPAILCHNLTCISVIDS
jgi:hypothetical protein